MENNYSFRNLRELRGSGYEIMSGEPDIIGWSIRDTSDRKLGVVNDLLFDPEQQKVRYIIANLKDNDYDLDRRKVLIPIGVAQLHENNDNVILDAVNPWQIRALPTYDKHMTGQDEQDIYAIFSSTTTALGSSSMPAQQNMYEHANYNYDNLFKNRSKDRPANKALGIRQREQSDINSASSREYEMRNEYINEQEEVPVSRNRDLADDHSRASDSSRLSDSNRGSDTYRSNDPMSSSVDDSRRDRLIEKLRNMKDDLNEIERDLRNSRNI